MPTLSIADLPFPAMVYGADRRVAGVNRALEELFGFQAREVLGLAVPPWVDPERADEVGGALDWAQVTAGPVRYEVERRRADGRLIQVAVETSAIRHGPGAGGTVVVYRPLPESPAHVESDETASAALVQARAREDELQRVLTSTTAEMEELRRSNERLRQFTHTVSHDLAQPLTTIGGYLELLVEETTGTLTDRQRGWLDRAVRGHLAMQSAIDALVRLARSEIETRNREVPLGALVSRVLDAINPTLRAAGARVHVDGELGAASVDPPLLVQVLQNVLVNACRYRHPARPLRIAISSEPAGDVMLLRVADNGRGFREGEHQRVFDLGVRGTAGSDRPGTGVGLATVQSIVTALRGRVWAEDTPGGGATIVVALPVEEAPDPGAGEPASG